METLPTNINKIKQGINEVCMAAGKNPDEIAIIAASKTVQPKTLEKLKDFGINICGENRVQELIEKYGKFDTEWHFIGRLQTNKVKYLIDKVSLIHSLDRVELAEEIERQCSRRGIEKCRALIEINAAGEESKGGIAPEDAENFFDLLKNYPHIEICGIMAMMPEAEFCDDKYYLLIKDIYDRIKERAGAGFKYLSMGMSGDYLTAIRHGSNMVRLGRALFGERKY